MIEQIELCPDAQSPDIEVACSTSTTVPTSLPGAGGELAFTGFDPWLLWLAIILLAGGLIVTVSDYFSARYSARRRQRNAL